MCLSMYVISALFSYYSVKPILSFPLSFNSDALISVTTAQLGEPVTLSCFFPESEYSNTRIKWYKQTIGDTLLLITTLMKATAYPTFEEGFPSSRFNVNHTTTSSILTILRTVQEDEAMYHCAVTTWSKDQWSGVYLSFKGNTCVCRITFFFSVSSQFVHLQF